MLPKFCVEEGQKALTEGWREKGQKALTEGWRKWGMPSVRPAGMRGLPYVTLKGTD